MSFIFYGWWKRTFLILITFTILCSWTSGILIDVSRKRKNKLPLVITTVNIIINLIILFYFKYYNFFIQSFIDAFTVFGKKINLNTLDIILPVGISFYTFQLLSYSIDVYLQKIEPTRDILAFFAFVSFFPQLVAGPIERASNLLPQFYVKRSFCYAKSVDGLRQILWGLFKKVVIADRCAVTVNIIFNNIDDYSGSTLVLGIILFSFQIYGDFSGYSDIAIGSGKLFGINLMRNFAFPYFSRDIAEFWRRWHISLSTWFRDYLYIPLGGSRGSIIQKARNTFIIFFVSGLWHGANWTFIAWGVLHAIYFLPLLLTNNNRKHIEIITDAPPPPPPGGNGKKNNTNIGDICFSFICMDFF
jgi:D-alanyl-lipoteichoic acid acyltransferase DltB (MBOAT superfamily)